MRGDPDPSFWKEKTVLVTGSGGFAGGHLTELLYKLGAKVRCFVREGEKPPLQGSRLTTAVGDVEDYSSLLRAFDSVDIGFHLAAITAISEARADIFKTFNTNALGTLNFLMAGREKKASKLVYASTCQVYGKQDHLPINENHLPHPIDIYSASKLAGESLAISFAETSQVDVSISRAFNHYGPRQRPDFLIPQVIMRLLTGKSLQLRNPASTRDFSYVDDIIRGYCLLAETGGPGEIYHLCSGDERSVQNTVETILKITGSRSNDYLDSASPTLDVSRSVGDYSKAKNQLGWTPRISFEDGLRKTVEWYKDHRAFYSPTS
jgi:nucleoside-diphosphate-sugar epimerase